MCLVGTVFGVIGAIKRETPKACYIVGLVLNVGPLVMLGAVLLMDAYK